MTADGLARGGAVLRLWPTALALATAAVVANAVLLFPYARALWWLHAYRLAPRTVVLPVSGVRPASIDPSFGAPRPGGRGHEGVDIMAASGTLVRAAADGIVIGTRQTQLGGNVVWVLGAGRRVYYYAHLRGLGTGIRMGRLVTAGEPLGTVGTSGNAALTPPHLHFGIYVVESDFYPLRYEAIDPYPMLLAATTN